MLAARGYETQTSGMSSKSTASSSCGRSSVRTYGKRELSGGKSAIETRMLRAGCLERCRMDGRSQATFYHFIILATLFTDEYFTSGQPPAQDAQHRNNVGVFCGPNGASVMSPVGV